jgi:hypothetical protein
MAVDSCTVSLKKWNKWRNMMEHVLASCHAGKGRLSPWKDQPQPRLDDSQDGCMASRMRTWQKETKACQEATEGCLESNEPTSSEVEAIAVHEKVPKEEAAVKTSRALKKWHGDQQLAIRHSQRTGPRAMVGPRRSLPPPCQEVTLKTTGATQSVLYRNLRREDVSA